MNETASLRDFLQTVSYAKHSADDIQIGKYEGCTKR